MKKIAMRLAIFGWVALIAGCTSLSVAPPPSLEKGARWGLLPILNHTETPQVGFRAETIVDSLLRAQGVTDLRRYPANLAQDALLEPAERKVIDQALIWARNENIRYAVTGAVQEWRYKVGVDGEPAVGMTLQVIDVRTGTVIWSAAGGRTGWSREALSAVAQKLARGLIEPLAAAAR